MRLLHSECSPGPAHTHRSPPRLSSPSALTCLPEPRISQFQWWIWQTAFGVRAVSPWRFCRQEGHPALGVSLFNLSLASRSSGQWAEPSHWHKEQTDALATLRPCFSLCTGLAPGTSLASFKPQHQLTKWYCHYTNMTEETKAERLSHLSRFTQLRALWIRGLTHL